jgi:hypothetical protein
MDDTSALAASVSVVLAAAAAMKLRRIEIFLLQIASDAVDDAGTDVAALLSSKHP